MPAAVPPTWTITCGTCGRGVSATVVSGWPQTGAVNRDREVAATQTLWLMCPSCEEGSVKLATGAVRPTAPAGRIVEGLPTDVERAWRDARIAHNVAVYTGAEMIWSKDPHACGRGQSGECGGKEVHRVHRRLGGQRLYHDPPRGRLGVVGVRCGLVSRFSVAGVCSECPGGPADIPRRHPCCS